MTHRGESYDTCCVYRTEKNRLSKYLVLRKRSFFWNINANQQFLYAMRNLITKLATNWLTNVKVIDLAIFLGQALFASLATTQTRA